ncbi:MAG: AAA family ATPase [bacterium]
MEQKDYIDLENPDFLEALEYLRNTRENLFLTGKAGTGKTTLLKYIKECFPGDIVVTAPTGIAAVNAGGVTLHSFFQLPFGPILPNDDRLMINRDSIKDSPIFHFFKYRSNKKKILKNLRLLIIDEISMVRADVLDAIDTIMRAYCGDLDKPFGGKQVLFIGDNYQLPPVVDGGLERLLSNFYRSSFFFDSNVLTALPPKIINLQHIYRQSDDVFIDLLNSVRVNDISQPELEKLNARYEPSFQPPENESYIIISTHNNVVDNINKSELAKLDSDLKAYQGEIEGNFNERDLPTKELLHLKLNSQVMFIKNDGDYPRKYYNGTIGKVIELGQNIVVQLDNGDEIVVSQNTWENITYKWNDEKKTIDEEIVGQFTQYPIKLAWAVTVHKSQGLTFDKVILDLQNCFAAGQVYVALSRCRTFEGIVLKSKIPRKAIITSGNVMAFENREYFGKTIFG